MNSFDNNNKQKENNNEFVQNLPLPEILRVSMFLVYIVIGVHVTCKMRRIEMCF